MKTSKSPRKYLKCILHNCILFRKPSLKASFLEDEFSQHRKYSKSIRRLQKRILQKSLVILPPISEAESKKASVLYQSYDTYISPSRRSGLDRNLTVDSRD
jgi:hypothetical protein